MEVAKLRKLVLADGRHAVDKLEQYHAVLVVGEADIVAVTVFQSECRGVGARGKALQLREEIVDDGLVLGIFGLRLDVAQVFLGKAACFAIAMAEFL